MKKSVLFLFMALCSVGLMAQSAVTGPVNAAPAPSVETVLQNTVTGIFSGLQSALPEKSTNYLHATTDIDQGIIVITMQYPPAYSDLIVTVSVKDSNDKRYWLDAYLFEGMSTCTVFPKYDAPFTMGKIVSVTPTEDEMYYYTFY